MDWPALTHDIAAAARQSFGDLLARHGDETFYAFALYTDEDCITIAPAANSQERHQATLAALDDKPDRQERNYYRWASSEWAYEAWAGEPFNPISSRLRAACAAVSGDAAAFAAFKAQVHQAMAGALRQLDGEGFFGRHRQEANAAVLFITAPDADDTEAMEDQSARLLNPPAVCKAFLQQHKDMG